LDDLDVTIQVIEHREQGAGEIINRIELPRPTAVDNSIGTNARRESGDSDRSDREHHSDTGASASAASRDIRQQSASVRENTGSVRGETRDASTDLRSESSQAVHDLGGDVRSSVQDASRDIRSSVQDTSSEAKDTSRDSVAEVKDQSQTSAQDARESATDDRDNHDD